MRKQISIHKGGLLCNNALVSLEGQHLYVEIYPHLSIHTYKLVTDKSELKYLHKNIYVQKHKYTDYT